jgi:AraC-like DNA-binding protein/mannose-6-phosphate isomerase-like protein (cupin superfamily)
MIAEHEIISYKKIRHINAFMINITYRSYHVHDDFEIFAVLSGKAVVRLLNSETHVSAGSVVIFNSRTAHEIDASSGEVVAVVIQTSPHFLREYIINMPRVFFSCTDLSTVLSESELRDFMNIVCETAVSYMKADSYYEYKCIENLMRIYGILTGKVPNKLINMKEHMYHVSKERRMEAITEYIDGNYQYGIRLEKLAEKFNMSPGYLSHFFTECFGISFQEYLNNIRFDHALRLISKPNVTLFDVSTTSGFSDPKYMTKMFEKKLGCTPKEYRRQLNSYKNPLMSPDSPHPLQFYYSDAEAIDMIDRYLKEH